jgi:hypothetical protein
VRYQAALRPDITGRIDSKARPNLVATLKHNFYPERTLVCLLSQNTFSSRARTTADIDRQEQQAFNCTP